MKYSFNPAHYLAANPDVAKDVAEGRTVSPWGHFVEVGCREGRAGVPDPIRKVARAVLDAPLLAPGPQILGKAAPDPAVYEMQGKVLALDAYSAVVPFFEMDHPLRILDFGCEFGRIARFLKVVSPLSKIRAVDGSPQAIDWCRVTYRDEIRRGHYSFDAAPAHPPLAFRSDYFDLVVGMSGLSSLPERQALEWLSEIKRITRPGGYLVLTLEAETLSKYFAILKQFPSGVRGRPDNVLCLKRVHMVI